MNFLGTFSSYFIVTNVVELINILVLNVHYRTTSLYVNRLPPSVAKFPTSQRCPHPADPHGVCSTLINLMMAGKQTQHNLSQQTFTNSQQQLDV